MADAFSFPAAELLAATHTTSVPNIRTFFLGPEPPGLFKALEFLGPRIVNTWPIRALVEGVVRSEPSGPTPEQV